MDSSRNSWDVLDEVSATTEKRCPSLGRSRILSMPDISHNFQSRGRSATIISSKIRRANPDHMYYKKHARDRIRGPIEKRDLRQKFYRRKLDFQTAEICTEEQLFSSGEFFSVLDAEENSEWGFILQSCLLDDHFRYTSHSSQPLPLGDFEDRHFMAQSAYELGQALEDKDSKLEYILDDCLRYLPQQHPLVFLARNEIDARSGAISHIKTFQMRGIGELQMLRLEDLYFSSIPYVSDELLELARMKLSRLYLKRAIVMSRLRSALEEGKSISESDFAKLKTAFPVQHPTMSLALQNV